MIHQNFDLRTNIAIRSQSTNLRILNAQLISRLGFISNEINSKKQEVLDDIEAIGNSESECVAEAALELDSASEYASYSLNMLMAEVMFYIDEVEKDYFYPLMRLLQWESNIIQWSVKAVMHRENPVTRADALIRRLEDDYQVMVALYSASINNIAGEVQAFDNKMNGVKETMFPQLNSIRDYFTFTVNLIKDSLTLCDA